MVKASRRRLLELAHEQARSAIYYQKLGLKSLARAEMKHSFILKKLAKR
jgi:hypothetical protein